MWTSGSVSLPVFLRLLRSQVVPSSRPHACPLLVIFKNTCLDLKLTFRLSSSNVISWSNFFIRQELCVFDTTNGEDKLLFSFNKSKAEMLHESPPVFHPTEPIVVWPVGYDSLLIANFSKGIKILHTHRATSVKGR